MKEEELKKETEEEKEWYNYGFEKGFLAGKLSSTERCLKMIEETKKRLGKLLIDNSKCHCREWTDKYRGISDVVFRELTQKVKDGKE